MTYANDKISWAERILSGDRRALARVISFLENQEQTGFLTLGRLYRQTGQAHIIGLTGPPGAGKSSLVDRMTQEIRTRGHSVAVVAVDPTSPFTGGAILGDRIRMQRWAVTPVYYPQHGYSRQPRRSSSAQSTPPFSFWTLLFPIF